MNERGLDEQIGAAIRAAAASAGAPDRLRARLADQRARRPRSLRARVADRRARPPRSLRARAGAQQAWPRRTRARLAAAGLATVALALALVVLSGGAPSVQEVAAAGLNPPTRPAPGADPRDAAAIDARVGGVEFPSLEEPWGWKAVGARTDEVAGRRAITVIYSDGELGVHYTIVEGDPLPAPEGARLVEADGRRFRVLRAGATRVVSWERGGHTCVLASRVLDVPGLLRLATWR